MVEHGSNLRTLHPSPLYLDPLRLIYLPEHWNPAYNILRQANATINNRYYGKGYRHGYWLYSEGKIYRQKRQQP